MSRQVNGPGDGTVSLRKDGRWEAKVVDPVTGKRRSVYGKSAAEARRHRREMLVRRESGQIVVDSAMTLAKFTEVWLESMAEKRRAGSTVREYERRLRSYVLPQSGHIKLNRLTVIDVENMLDAVASQGLSRSTVRGAKNALSAMVNDARKRRLLAANVVADAVLPDIPPSPVAATPTVGEVANLLVHAHGTELREILIVLAFTGCRIGEALGARWGDFDLEGGSWRVCSTTALDRSGRVFVKDLTKTKESRTVYLQPEAVSALKVQRARVLSSRLRAGTLWQERDLAFPSSVGTPQDARNLRKPFRDLAKSSGFHHSFHKLRHLYATVVASEASLAALSKLMGHRRIATTVEVYGHLYEADAVNASAAIGRALGSR